MVPIRRWIFLSLCLLSAYGPALGQQDLEKVVGLLRDLVRDHASVANRSTYRMSFDSKNPCAITVVETSVGADQTVNRTWVKANLMDLSAVASSARALELRAMRGTSSSMQSQYTWTKTSGEVLSSEPETVRSFMVYLDRADDGARALILATFNQARNLCRSQYATPDSAVPERPADPPADPSQLARYAQKEWLAPVLEDLKRRSAGDKKLFALLQNLELRTLAVPRPMWGPNAIATFDEKTGRPVVYVDLVYLNGLFDVADLGGLALTGRKEAGSILWSAGFSYGQKLAQAKALGRSAPSFRFKLSEANVEPGLDVMAERLSSEVFFSGVAWVVLHEVAHHLRHFDREPPTTLQGQRMLELDADTWAFSAMEALGYGLDPLHAAIGALEVGEQVRLMGGFGQPESELDHPSWTTRRTELEGRHDLRRPPQGRILVLLTVGGEDLGRMAIEETWVPRTPDSDGDLFAFFKQGGQPVQRLPFEWIAGEVHLYGRDAKNYSEIVIHDPGSLRPRVTFRHVPVSGGPETTITTRGYQISTTPVGHLRVGPVSAREVLATSPRAIISSALAATANSDSSTRIAAEQVQMEHLRETRRLLIRYSKGLLSLSAATAEYESARARARLRLSTLLGEDGLARLERAARVNPVVQFGLSTLPPAKP